MIDLQSTFAELLQNPRGEPHPFLQWTISKDLPYFNGHFPGTPVFPAIGIVDASFVLLRHVLERPELRLMGVTSAKFLSPIAPGTDLRLEWQKGVGQTWRVDWKQAASQEPLATVQLLVEG